MNKPRWMLLLGTVLFTGMASLAMAQSDAPRFSISRFEVAGNSVIPAEDVARLLAPYAGADRDFSHVQKALEALQAEYGARGFGAIQVYLPEQELESGGVVRLNVIEARVSSVKVEGNQFHDEANVRYAVPGLKEGVSPNTRDIAQSIRVANENPTKQTTVVMKGGSKENEIDAILKVTDEKPWRVITNLDNTGNTSTGEYRLGIALQHTNLFNRDHVLSFQHITSPQKPKDVKIWGLAYRVPLYEWGDNIDVFWGKSAVNSGTISTAVDSFAVSGSGRVFALHYTKSLPRQGDYDHKLGFFYDERFFDNACSSALFGAAGCGAANSRVRVRPLSLNYTGKYRVEGMEIEGGLSYSRNWKGGTNGHDADFAGARGVAQGDYDVWRWNARLTKAFEGDWQMNLAMNGQITADPLIPAEQFGVGGADSVRGFGEREIANDTGFRGSAEFITPDMGNITGNPNMNLRGVLFYDFASLRRNRMLPGEDPGQSIASYGAGLRFNAGKTFGARVDYAVVSDAGGNQGDRDHMVHVSLNFLF